MTVASQKSAEFVAERLYSLGTQSLKAERQGRRRAPVAVDQSVELKSKRRGEKHYAITAIKCLLEIAALCEGKAKVDAAVTSGNVNYSVADLAAYLAVSLADRAVDQFLDLGRGLSASHVPQDLAPVGFSGEKILYDHSAHFSMIAERLSRILAATSGLFIE
jgi:hypothetical protein